MEHTLTKSEEYILNLKDQFVLNPKAGEDLEALEFVSLLKDDDFLGDEMYHIYITEERNHGSIPCHIIDGVFNFKHIDCSEFNAANLPRTPEDEMFLSVYTKVNHILGDNGKPLTEREERIKEREGDRLYRSLRRIFGKPFDFEWTNDETSYYNGNTIFVKHDLQTQRHRPFTQTELRALRHGHGVHEAGHSEYDYLPHYVEWQEEMSAKCKQDYLDNLKYPHPWLQFFGNMGLDGRMERLILLKTPSQQPFLDLNNYDWRFGDRFEGVGQSPINDFRHAYAHRVLGMEDLDCWVEDALELIDSVQPLVDEIRKAPSTKLCLEHVSTLIQTVWPTLLSWMDLDEDEPSDDDSFTEDMTQGSWSESAEEAVQRSESVIEHYDSSSDSTDKETKGGKEADSSKGEGTDGYESDSSKDDEDSPESKREQLKKSMIRQIEKLLENDMKEVQKELEALEATNVNVSFQGQSGPLSSVIKEHPIPNPSLETYKESFKKIERFVKPVARELSALLEGVPEQPRRNVRSGRFMAGQAWRAVHCDDSQVFSKQLKGTPKEDAFIACMTDVSGSTWSHLSNGVPIYEEMRKALSLLLEASNLSNIPTEAYAFTEFDETHIFRMKPTDAPLDDAHRKAIGGIQPFSGNRDTVALKYMLDRVQVRTEGIRLAIMLSDGVPTFEENEGPETIQKMVKEAEKQGIMVLCLFIGEQDPYTIAEVKKMYPSRVIFAEKGIAKELQKHVKRIIRQHR